MPFLYEFLTNTSFLAFPLFIKTFLYWWNMFLYPLNLFLLFLIILQTYLLTKTKSNLKIFFYNIIFISIYFFVRWFIEWFSFLLEPMYLFFIWFVIINAFFRANFFLPKSLIVFFYNFLKILILPWFYYFILYNEWFTKLSILEFYSTNNGKVLLIIFLFIAFLYAFLLYLIENEKEKIKKLNSILYKYSKFIVDDEEIKSSLDKWYLNLSWKKTYKVVIFMDIRGFTSWSEKHSPQDIVNLLNWFYDTAENVLEKWYTWKINKFVADEIVLIFDNLQEAIRFSKELLKEEIKYLSKFWLKVWIWINAGEVFFWWVGSDNKKEQTILWDVVNTTARLEWWENQILMLKDIIPENIEYENIWKIKLKWKEKEQEIVSIRF